MPTKMPTKKHTPRRKKGEHLFTDCGGYPRCVTCGADEDDAFVGGEPCTYKPVPRKILTERINRHPIACYDNSGKTIDRYTVVYLDQPERGKGVFSAVGMNCEPFHPQGFGQHTTAMLGSHLGKRVKFSELPADCQRLVRNDLTP